MTGEEFREGASVEEFGRLKGAVIEEVAADGDGYRLTLKLTDGRTLTGRVTADEYDALIVGTVPIMTNVEVSS